jgi:segregation and condensation protein B
MVSSAERAVVTEPSENESSAATPAACGDQPLTARIEALVLASDRPLGEGKLVELLGMVPEPGRRRGEGGDVPSKARREAVKQVREAIEQLNAAYASTGRSFRIEELAAGWQVLTLPAFGPLIARLRGDRAQQKLSQAALETLAIVAYRQPILRADLESIRGVACGEILKTLLDRRLVKIVGRAEEVGRPMLYGTTQEFLRIFGLASLSDLPQAKELRPS